MEDVAKPLAHRSVYLSRYNDPILTIAGVVMTLTGQALRSIAMIHASTNFAHQVAFDKRSNHQLVTSGVYAYVSFLFLR